MDRLVLDNLTQTIEFGVLSRTLVTAFSALCSCGGDYEIYYNSVLNYSCVKRSQDVGEKISFDLVELCRTSGLWSGPLSEISFFSSGNPHSRNRKKIVEVPFGVRDECLSLIS